MVRHVCRLLPFIGSLFLFWLIAAPSAQAYIDPGSGQFVVQIIVGVLAGAGLAIATFWRRIKAFFTKNKQMTTDEEPPERQAAVDPVDEIHGEQTPSAEPPSSTTQ